MSVNFSIKQKIPKPSEIIADISPSPDMLLVKKNIDAEIKSIIEGKSEKFLVIVGPCSANDENAVCDYISRLKKVQIEVKDKLLIIPRVYSNKPRTTVEGYKGMWHQPDPEKPPNVLNGIKSVRKMHLRAMKESGMPTSDEMLYPSNIEYIEDLLSYVAIGARSVENQEHRLVASGVSLPVGMKNPTSGNLSVMFNSIQAAQKGHTFIYGDHEIETEGNPLAHGIIRGYTNRNGQNRPNYHYRSLLSTCETYLERNLKNPMIIVDVNHSNSNKKWFEQPRIIENVLQSRQRNSSIEDVVKGVMIESYIEGGSQDPSGKVYGKSITDPCLSWNHTQEVLYYIADNV